MGFTARLQGTTVEEKNAAYNVTASSYRMEQQAASEALEWLSTTTHTGAAIITDSESMLRKVKLRLMKPEWIASIKRSRLKHLVWIFTPGHAGVNDNERADWLAGNATVKYDSYLEMGERDVLTALREKEPEEKGETVCRLQANGYKKGSAASASISGTYRYISNQIVTGTISRRTLAHVLAERTEQIWTCPECCEVNSAPK